MNNVRIRNQGKLYVVGVAAYKNVDCTVKAETVDWGTFYAGDDVYRTIYLRNEGNMPFVLNLVFGNWTPANAGNFMSLTWDYANDTAIMPNLVVPTVFTLHSVYAPYPNIDFVAFSFDITVEAAALL